MIFRSSPKKYSGPWERFKEKKMTLRNFKHISASSLKEATAILSKGNGQAVAIAGGTDLLGVLKDKIHDQAHETVVDLKTIPRLN